MPQSLIQLPKEAEFEIDGWPIHIQNHRVTGNGLFSQILMIVSSLNSDANTLRLFEEHGISCEMIIEECAKELENDSEVLAHVIRWHCGNLKIKSVLAIDTTDAIFLFSKSVPGRKIAEQFIEKIRSCDNWEELYDEMLLYSRFRMDVKRRIVKGINVLINKAYNKDMQNIARKAYFAIQSRKVIKESEGNPVEMKEQ